MTISIIDLSTILWSTIIDVIIDMVVFKLFKVKGVTVAVTILLNFIIPFLSFWFFIQSNPPIEQQVLAFGNFITYLIVNFVNFLMSAVFGYIITAIIFIFSGGRTPEPEF